MFWIEFPVKDERACLLCELGKPVEKVMLPIVDVQAQAYEWLQVKYLSLSKVTLDELTDMIERSMAFDRIRKAQRRFRYSKMIWRARGVR